jgi:hypothetical protein
MGRELPSQGRCHASFLLAYTALLVAPRTFDAWLNASSARTTFVAAAADLRSTADTLLRCELIKDDGNSIRVSGKLARLCTQADRPSLLGIARLLLERFPPPWLFTALAADQFAPELIPQDDLIALEWIGVDLEPLLRGVYRRLTSEKNEQIKRRLGLAGEMAVMSALRHSGHIPNHVALLSDTFGYDIECAMGVDTLLYEVKSSVEATSDRIFVSRNEFDVAHRNQKSWRLIQTIFSSAVSFREIIMADDIMKFRMLDAAVLNSLAPPDNDTFFWRESAQFSPKLSHWKTLNIEVEPSFKVDFREFELN